VRVNFEPKLYAKIREAAGLTKPLAMLKGTAAFRKATGDVRPDEIKVFDYIYGVLHSPAYRSNFGMALKRGLSARAIPGRRGGLQPFQRGRRGNAASFDGRRRSTIHRCLRRRR